MISWQFVWIGIIIVGLIVEVVTVGLSAVWFSCGALCAFLAGRYGCSDNTQIALFLIVTAGLSFFLRPFTVKLFCRRKSSHYAEELIGQKVRVIAEVDNLKGEGRVLVGNMEWRAKSKRDEYTFDAGSTAVIDHIEGIVLILAPDTPVDNAMAEI